MSDWVANNEGDAPFTVPSIDTPCYTHYWIFGELGVAPAVIIGHGGPGISHEYLLPFARLWTDYDLPVVFYDQIGCGGSTRLPDKAGDDSFWQESLFIEELNNLVDHLGLREDAGFHFLGHSWGGSLGAAFAATRPRGLKRLVIASGLSDWTLGARGMRLLREDLPPETRQTLNDAAERGDTSSPEYKAAQMVFYQKHLCRESPFPAELVMSMENVARDPTVYSTMYGPSSVTPSGSLADWTVVPRLSSIQVPTLVYNGEHDTSHDIATEAFFERIPRVRWITFAHAGHMSHLEGNGVRERVFKVVGTFLTAETAPGG